METIKPRTDFFPAPEISHHYNFLNPGTMANLRCKKKGPRFYKRGHLVLYRFSDIDAWLASQPVLTHDSMPE